MSQISDRQDAGGEPEVALHERSHEVLLASSVAALGTPRRSGADAGPSSPGAIDGTGTHDRAGTADGAGGLSAEESLVAIESAHALGARLELVRLRAVQQLALRTGQEILAQRGYSDESGMSEHARKQWRAACKRVAATEIHALTGLGKGRARQLVAIALAPQPVAVPVHQALGAGIARFEHVETFWVRCRRLPHELAARVALALFATTGVKPDQVAVERLDPEGRIGHEPWRSKEFAEALEREATRAEGQDPEAAAKQREQIHQDRTAYGIVDDDGSGQVVITGDGISTTACVDRLQDLAHRARAAGDERTEAQLRSDVARALLLYGILPLPEPNPSHDPDLVASPEPSSSPESGPGPDDRGVASLFAPADLDLLSQVLSGAPGVQMQVIVPWDVLTGQAVMASQTSDPLDAKTRSGTKTATETTGTQVGRGAATETQAPPQTEHDGRSTEEERRVEGVGRVVGNTPRFLTGESVRALALAPGPPCTGCSSTLPTGGASSGASTGTARMPPCALRCRPPTFCPGRPGPPCPSSTARSTTSGPGRTAARRPRPTCRVWTCRGTR